MERIGVHSLWETFGQRLDCLHTRLILASLEVRDASEANAYRIPTNHLTRVMFGWTVDPEQQANKERPQLVFNSGSGFTKTDVHLSIRDLIVDAPHKLL